MDTFVVYSVNPKVCIIFAIYIRTSFVLVENCFRKEMIFMPKLSEKSFTQQMLQGVQFFDAKTNVINQSLF